MSLVVSEGRYCSAEGETMTKCTDSTKPVTLHGYPPVSFSLDIFLIFLCCLSVAYIASSTSPLKRAQNSKTAVVVMGGLQSYDVLDGTTKFSFF